MNIVIFRLQKSNMMKSQAAILLFLRFRFTWTAFHRSFSIYLWNWKKETLPRMQWFTVFLIMASLRENKIILH